MFKPLALAMIVATLAACGGGGDSTEQTTAAPATISPTLPALRPLHAADCASNGRQVRIQLFGDSTQAGAIGGGAYTTTHTPAKLLQADMDAVFGAGSVIVESRAVGNTTSLQLLNGTDGLNQPWPQSVAADIVVINHGINDSRHHLVGEYANRLRDMVINTPAAVVLETPNPTKFEHTAEFAEAMRAVARGTGTELADTEAFVKTLGAPLQWMAADQVHPQEQLYPHIVRGVLMPKLAPMVATLHCAS